MLPVVITGIGVVAPGGIGRETFWGTLISGKSACNRASLRDPERFRSQIAGEVTPWEPYALGLNAEEV